LRNHQAELGILDTDDEPTTRRRLDDALLVSDTEGRAARRGTRPAGRPARDRLGPDETELAWRRFIHAMARRSQPVLIFGDMHWADEKMLRLE
jgi:hypothetical protein